MLENNIAAIKTFYKMNKRLPSYSEMLPLFGFSSKNAVFKVISKCIEQGMIKKVNGKLAPTSSFFALPLLGIVKAGYPILAEENKTYMTIDDYLINDPNRSFLLKVSGDSMIEVGIFEGDIVIVEKKEQADSGDIVLAQVDREWTLKIFRNTNGRIFLEAANPTYKPIYPKQQLQIYGIVRGLVRKFS